MDLDGASYSPFDRAGLVAGEVDADTSGYKSSSTHSQARTETIKKIEMEQLWEQILAYGSKEQAKRAAAAAGAAPPAHSPVSWSPKDGFSSCLGLLRPGCPATAAGRRSDLRSIVRLHQGPQLSGPSRVMGLPAVLL